MWYRTVSTGVELFVHVQPNSQKTEVVGTYQERLKIKVAALAVDGKANVALVRFIAEQLGIPRTNVTVIRGHTSKRKIVLVRNIQPIQLHVLSAHLTAS